MTRCLVVCNHGETRSVAMTYVLHEKGHEAIALSANVYEQLYHVLNGWCDAVLFMDDASQTADFSGDHDSMAHNAWIGKDIWNNPNHPELLEKCKKKLEELGI